MNVATAYLPWPLRDGDGSLLCLPPSNLQRRHYNGAPRIDTEYWLEDIRQSL